MVSPAVAAAIAGSSTLLLAAAVGVAGGWRQAPPHRDAPPELLPDPPPGLPPEAPAGQPPAANSASARQLRMAAQIYPVAVLAVLGLTSLGAWLVHLIAPAGSQLRTSVAVLVIVLAAWGPPTLLFICWPDRVRRFELSQGRPRRPWSRLPWLVLPAWTLAYWLAVFAAHPDDFAALVIVLPLLAVAGGLLRLDRIVRNLDLMPKSERLDSALRSVLEHTSWRGPAGMPSVTAALSRNSRTVNAVAVSSLRRHGIVAGPRLVDALTDAQLRTVVAHELAHIRNHDLWWRLLRLYLSLLASMAAALALYGAPWLRGLAGLHTAAITGQALPLLLAIGFLAGRVTRAMELRARRAEEVTADRQAIQVTADPRAHLAAMAILGSLSGTPAAWTLPQRLLIATHPASGERLRLIADAVGQPAASDPAARPASQRPGVTEPRLPP